MGPCGNSVFRWYKQMRAVPYPHSSSSMTPNTFLGSQDGDIPEDACQRQHTHLHSANGDKSAMKNSKMRSSKRKISKVVVGVPALLLCIGLLILSAQHTLLTLHRLTEWSQTNFVSINRDVFPGRHKQGKGIICDRTHYRTDICNIFGDIQMQNNLSSFLLSVQDKKILGITEKIRPYTRKWEKDVMNGVHEVTLKTVKSSNSFNRSCNVLHEVPAIVFSTGGYTGNVYHEFNDGIIPLYITSQHLNKEVILVNVECHNWWLTKYDEILKQMTNYKVINFDNETQLHCFKEVTVGLVIHDELTVDPRLMLNGKTILDFRALLNNAYTPHWFLPQPSSDKPKLVILVREGSRMMLNLNEVVQVAEDIGFNVSLWKPQPTTELKTTYELFNSSHVLLGVHGAGLTHFLFMRPGSVFIQVIPLGTDWASYAYYGEPAEKMGLQYIGYNIEIEESTLYEKYDRDNIILKDPQTVGKQGWATTKQIYLESQNVVMNLHRMKSTLQDAFQKATIFMEQ